MNWLQYTENKKKFLVSGIVILCVAMLMLSARRNVISFDGYWHLKMGLDWLQKGLSPWVDHYSFTFNGHNISNPPYLFQGLIAILVKLFGVEPGFQIYRFASFITLFSLVFFFLKKLKSYTVVYAFILLMTVVLLQYRTLARPELISYCFSIVAMMLYYQAGKQMSYRHLIPMVGLMWIWSNYHFPVIGYIIFFGYFIDIAIVQFKQHVDYKTWLKWSGWGLIIVFVGFLTPKFHHPLISILTFSPEWKDMIQEYGPAYIVYKNAYALYILAILSLFTLIQLARNRQIGLLISCAILIYSAVTMARMVTPAGIIVLCAFSWMISLSNLQSIFISKPAYIQKITGAVYLLIISIIIWAGVTIPRGYMQENKLTAARYPFDIVEYMLKNNLSGKIFNEYGLGGYLIYKLAPNSKFYIDGRTNVLYPLEHFKRYSMALQSTASLQAEIDKYNINLAILGNSPSTFLLFAGTKNFHLDYVGASFSLFKKENPNFPLFGKLLAYPACWEPKLIEQLEKEFELANDILPSYSPILPYMKQVLTYSAAENKSAYLNDQIKSGEKEELLLRFIAYQAIQQNLDSLVLSTLGGLNRWVFTDFLLAALANIHMDELQEAEKILNHAITVQWVSVQPAEIEFAYLLLNYLQKNSTLTVIDNKIIDQLAKEIGYNVEKSYALPTQNMFCATKGS